MLHTISSPDSTMERRRQQRLAEVKRGAEFYKRIEMLADAYWRGLDPTARLPDVRGRGQRLTPVYTESSPTCNPSRVASDSIGASRNTLNGQLSRSLPILPKVVTFAISPAPSSDLQQRCSLDLETPEIERISEKVVANGPEYVDRKSNHLGHLVDKRVLCSLAESKESGFESAERESISLENERKMANRIRRTTLKDNLRLRRYNHRTKLLQEFEQPLERDNTRLILNRVEKLLEPDKMSVLSAEGSSRYEWDRASSVDISDLDAMLGNVEFGEGHSMPEADARDGAADDFEEFLKDLNRMSAFEKCTFWLRKYFS